jgi:hypothetical protein
MTAMTPLAAWSATHHGVVTHGRLVTLGYTRHRIARLVDDGTLERVAHAVYVVTAAPSTPVQRLAIAVAATGGAVSHVTSGREWQYRKLPTETLVDVTVEHGRSRRSASVPPWIRLHRTRSLPAEDVVRRGDGVVLTSPPRTVFDLACVLDADALESVVEQGIDLGHFGVPTLERVAARLARPGRDGSGRFREVLGRRPAWQRPVGSDDELVLARALEALGLPVPVRQAAIRLPDGRVVHPDLAWPEARLVVEVDHATWHDPEDAKAYDKWRDRHVRRVGWVVERVPDRDVRQRLDATAREIAERYRQCLAGAGTAAVR